MDRIITDPRLVPIEGTYLWWLAEDFQVWDDVLGTITVPRYFITDLGSIPKIFWNIIPPEGPATDAYVVHDGLYGFQSSAILSSNPPIRPITSVPYIQSDADQTLLRLMLKLGVGWLARYTVYAALRVAGSVAWESDARTGPRFYTPAP